MESCVAGMSQYEIVDKLGEGELELVNLSFPQSDPW